MADLNALRLQQRNDLACDVTVSEGPHAIADAASAWQAIEARGGSATSFQSLTVARASAQAHLRDGLSPRIVLVRHRGRPVVIFPTVVGQLAGIPTVRFLGDPFIQYGDAVVAPEALPEHLDAAWSAALNPQIASVGIFRKVRSDSKAAGLMTRGATAIAEGHAPFVDLRVDQQASSRHLREVRRMRRRLAEQGGLRFEICQGQAAAGVLDETLALKRAWLIERGLPSSVIGRPTWEGALFEMANVDSSSCEMTVARLVIGDRTAATEIGFLNATTWFAYTGALAPEFARHGPGHVLMDEIIKWCGETGRQVYDLLPPSQPYKTALANGTMLVRDYAVALNPAGRLMIPAVRLIPTAKRLVERVPLSLRRWCVSSYLKMAGKVQ